MGDTTKYRYKNKPIHSFGMKFSLKVGNSAEIFIIKYLRFSFKIIYLLFLTEGNFNYNNNNTN